MSQSPCEPVRAFKLGSLVRLGERALFQPLFRPGVVPAAEAKATCGLLDEHGPAPKLDCICGFYAVKPDQRHRLCSSMCGTNYLMEVELYGKIIEHKYGYRAEYQRVLSAQALEHTFAAARQFTGPSRDQYVQCMLGLSNYIIPAAALWSDKQVHEVSVGDVFLGHAVTHVFTRAELSGMAGTEILPMKRAEEE